MPPRKVTFNMTEGLFKDANGMKGLLGHSTTSALVEAAAEEYVVSHVLRLHTEWRSQNLTNEGTPS